MPFSPRRRSHIIAAIAEKGAYKGRIKKHTYELVKLVKYGDGFVHSDLPEAKPISVTISWCVCIARQWHEGFAPTVWCALEAVEEAVGY